ncbi:hypothetical protein MKEN_00213300 [Mycena kentingensis (nom. inval.)]|nr:hypothetical protein MKEN_00213300 [Mycena kentingensis (nom. inval.)]
MSRSGGGSLLIRYVRICNLLLTSTVVRWPSAFAQTMPPETSALRSSVQTQLETLIRGVLSFNGGFVFHAKYSMSDAPNPCIGIDDVGTVGLPLSAFEAERIALQIPHGECRAPTISCQNDAWSVWLTSTVVPALSLALEMDSVTLELNKLMLRTKPATSTALRTGSLKPGKIGELAIFLPCAFDGGACTFRHDGEEREFNIAADSRLSTTVIAAYTGVQDIAADISSGYACSLIYDIVYCGKGPQPALPDVKKADGALEALLRAWKDAGGAGPEYLVCVLRRYYPLVPPLSSSSLIGADSLLLRRLEPIARCLGFHVALGQLERLPGPFIFEERLWEAEPGAQQQSAQRDRTFFDDDDDDVVPVRLIALNDIKGVPLCPTSLPSEWKPGQWATLGIGARYPHKDEEWRRNAIFIWPKEGPVHRSLHAGTVYDFAFAHLDGSTSTIPTALEQRAVEQLLTACETEIGDERDSQRVRRAFVALRESAERWDEPGLFRRAAQCCRVREDFSLLGVGPEFLSVYKKFGWATLESLCNQTMQDDPSHIRRGSLFVRLARLVVNEYDVGISEWLDTQTAALLPPSVKEEDVPWLVEMITADPTFPAKIVPQLRALDPPVAVWGKLVRQLASLAADGPPDVPVYLRESLEALIAVLPAFPISRYAPQTNLPLDTLKLCMKLGAPQLCSKLFSRMRDAARSGDFNDDGKPWQYYDELVKPVSLILANLKSGAIGVRQQFRLFYEDLVFSFLLGHITSQYSSTSFNCYLASRVDTVFDAMEQLDGFKFLRSLSAQNFFGRDADDLIDFAESARKRWPRERLTDDVERGEYDDIFTSFIGVIVDAFVWPLQSCTPGIFRRLLDLCGQTPQATYLYGRALLRFMRPAEGATSEAHLTNLLGPFIAGLPVFLAARNLAVTDEPFSQFAAVCMRRYAVEVVGEKPRGPDVLQLSAAQIRSVGCSNCTHCETLREFLDDDEEECCFEEVSGIRKHLEAKLAGTANWGFEWDTDENILDRRGPHILRVEKPESVLVIQRWKTRSRDARKILESLGNVDAQKSILGANYTSICALIDGTASEKLLVLLNPQKRSADSEAEGSRDAKKSRGD